MNDYLDSVDDEEKAIQLIKDVTEVHNRGGFEIRGWTSNSQAVLNSIPKEKLATGIHSRVLDPAHTERTLGLRWPNRMSSPLLPTLKEYPRK